MVRSDSVDEISNRPHDVKLSDSLSDLLRVVLLLGFVTVLILG